MKKTKPIRYKIKALKQLVKLGKFTEQDIQELREKGLVIEKRVNEIRYIPNTTLIPHFYFKNAKNNKLNDEARKMKMAIKLLIKEFTISKVEYDKKSK